MQTTLDDDVIVVEDLDFDPLCCAQETYGCDKNAEWILRKMCCNDVYLFCTEHKHTFMRDVSNAIFAYKCMKCHTVYFKENLHLLVWDRL